MRVQFTAEEELIEDLDEKVENKRFIDNRSQAIRWAIVEHFDLDEDDVPERQR